MCCAPSTGAVFPIPLIVKPLAHRVVAGAEPEGVLVEDHESRVTLELPGVPLGDDGAVDLGDELVLRGVEHHRLQAGDGGGVGIAEVHPEDAHRAEEEPDGRVVGERGQHREERLERLGPVALLLAQADRDEQVGLVTVRLAPSRAADGAVAVPCAALRAVLAGRLRILARLGFRTLPGGAGHGRDQQSHGKGQLPDGSKVPHASPSARGTSSEREPPVPAGPRTLSTRGASAGNRWTLVSL